MPLSTTCPNCKALFKLPNELAGKKVKCQKCQELFIVPHSEADTTQPGERASTGVKRTTKADFPGSAPMPPRPAPPPVDDDDPGEDKEANDDKKRSRRDDDEDDDEDRPRRRRSDDDQPPRRVQAKRKKKKAASGMLGWVLIGTGAVLLLCVTCGGSGVGIWIALKEKGGGMVRRSEPIKINLDAAGQFTSNNSLQGNDILKDGRRMKVFTIDMQRGRTYHIEMRSGEIDPFLFVLDPNNNVVAQDDDNGGGLDARIIFTPLRDGVFRIEATTFDLDDTGPFILTVRRF